MDADTKAALDATADALMQTPQDSAADYLRYKTLLTDGVCRITAVEDCPAHLPCVGILKTDLGERFPVFRWSVLEIARIFVGRRVKLAIQMSDRGTRYVTGLATLPSDTSAPSWPCLKCGGIAKVRTSGDGAGRYYDSVVEALLILRSRVVLRPVPVLLSSIAKIFRHWRETAREQRC